jgi:DNA-binding response OmpR family regulator
MSGSKILLVDDDPAIRGFTSLILESEGFAVVTAADGAEGLQLVHDEVPEAIVLDMMMPDVSGWDFLQQWREDADYRPVPIIVVTACGEEIRADELGVQAIFTKPLDLDRLIGKLTRLLARPVA